MLVSALVRDLDVLRSKTSDWLSANWDPDATMRQWWRRLADAGLCAPQWPKDWFGLGYGAEEASAVRKVITEAGVPGPPAGIGMMMAGPTILAHGSDEQKARYLPGIVSGEANWCQLFSEPQAGSDLAGLRTTAQRDTGKWRVNGQKLWTSNGHLANVGMLLARTDSTAPKHRGITWFICDMDQPGIEVRPLREMTGRSLFNEVFLTDAVVSDDEIVGELNDGWAVARTTLAAERSAMSGGSDLVGGVPGRKGGILEQAAGEVAERMRGPRRKSGTAMAMRGKNFTILRDLAAERHRLEDPTVRYALLDLLFREKVIEYSRSRAQDGRARGQLSGSESSIGKLMSSEAARIARDLALEILSADGMLDGSDAPMEGVFQEMALFSPAVSIYGGSDEIQRNVLAERILNLPKDSWSGSA